MGDPDLPSMITVDELARISGLARQTIYNKVNKQRRGEDVGRFPSPVRLGRSLRFQRAAVSRWLAEGDGGSVDATAPTPPEPRSAS